MPDPAPQDAFAACRETVRLGDKDHYLALLFAPEVLQPPLFALAAFTTELARIPSLVSESPIGEIRLQWWADTLAAMESGEGGSHPVAQAMAETVATSPAFRTSFARRRCIVPADGFYEWDRAGGTKQPYLLRPPEDGVLALAGLWAVWKDPATGLWVPSAAVITTEANGAVGQIHDRMPVLLPRDAWARWLDPATPDPAELLGLLVPAPDDVLALIAVSKAVNNVRNDSPDLLIPLADLPPAPLPAPAPEGPTQGTLFD